MTHRLQYECSTLTYHIAFAKKFESAIQPEGVCERQTGQPVDSDSDCIRTQLMMMEFTQYVSANRPHVKQNNSDQPTPTAPTSTPPPLPKLILAGVLTFSVHNFRLLRRGFPVAGDIPYGIANTSWLPSFNHSVPTRTLLHLATILPPPPHPLSIPLRDVPTLSRPFVTTTGSSPCLLILTSRAPVVCEASKLSDNR